MSAIQKNHTKEDEQMLLCKECFFHDYEETGCMKGCDVPKEGEGCKFFKASIAEDIDIFCSFGDK
jgi:hypothetical protein